MKDKWEYKFVQFPFEDKPDIPRACNRLGEEGWELVSALAMEYENGTAGIVVFFKRRLES